MSTPAFSLLCAAFYCEELADDDPGPGEISMGRLTLDFPEAPPSLDSSDPETRAWIIFHLTVALEKAKMSDFGVDNAAADKCPDALLVLDGPFFGDNIESVRFAGRPFEEKIQIVNQVFECATDMVRPTSPHSIHVDAVPDEARKPTVH